MHAHVLNESAILSVSDDGAGGTENPGRGLAGMRARAASLGGTVDIARGNGWTVTVRIPLHQAANAAVPAQAALT